LAEFNLDFSTRQTSRILQQIPYHVQAITSVWPVELECDALKVRDML